MELSSLSPVAGSRKNRKRVGRGNACGWGRTSGRGEKGQKARTGGKVAPRFEGGQMPLYRRLPNIGFKSKKQITGINKYSLIKCSDLEQFDDGTVIDMELLYQSGFKCSLNQKAGFKLVGTGDLSKNLTIKLNAFTKSAIEKVQKAGGTVELL